ncbi:NADH dehydrogenase [ubiquinone] 1 beta subcomplex subunit 7 [Eurytemora carolleeae]|uniref:NADH dehydrogenase [ubiquinone] 1 beta subcomplex subunit 7 n=1 Tax=Eurytemora carolleeae TaxID=1294199 RepID=UPI000C7693B1|nr:NADH dehydrogenase [ubiquinone] 1 beta subcomplex subunit 7 [Eurytemora carolleeae]|eukprot:XP_023345884.1 NADH dehydrogenase [ubiquinone] 1 beta subcomplex subunit 7-like [Eurytemora affinis]
MGNTWVREFREGPEITPRQDSVPTFDPMLGFPNGRKPRVMTVTAEEMDAVQLQPGERNFCAEYHIAAKVCFWKYPWFMNFKCSHEKHAVDECLREDYKLRMMEWERERRLRIRQKKIDELEAAESLD